MSLINDALKKAQKLQMQGQAQPPPNPGGAPGVSGAPDRPAGSGGDRSMPGQIFMLLAFGAGVLIALSVLATVYLLRQPAAPIAPEKPALAPVVNAPPPGLPVPRSLGEGGSPSNGPALAQTAPPPAPVLEKFPTTIPTPSVAAAPVPAVAPAVPDTRPAPPALPVLRDSSEGVSLPAVSLPNPSNGPALSLSNGLDPSKPDPRILAYLDAMQIAGVRVSNSGSKVLMNDRVFREGEIVDRLLGLRLTKIKSDLLTFVDERGVIYTKNL